jgi:hypothetical protein
MHPIVPFVDYLDLVKDSILERNLLLYKPLRAGIYHIHNVFVHMDPFTMILTVYLDCLEGKFKSGAVPLVCEFSTYAYGIVKKALETYDYVRVEFVPHKVGTKRRVGLSLNYRMEQILYPERRPNVDPKVVFEATAPEPLPVKEPQNEANMATVEPKVEIQNIPQTEQELRERYNELMVQFNKAQDDTERNKINEELCKIALELNTLSAISK